MDAFPTDAKYMNPRISFDGLNWWISVCGNFLTAGKRLMVMELV